MIILIEKKKKEEEEEAGSCLVTISPLFWCFVLPAFEHKGTWLTWAVAGTLGKCIGNVGQFMPIVSIFQGTDIQVVPLL